MTSRGGGQSTSTSVLPALQLFTASPKPWNVADFQRQSCARCQIYRISTTSSVLTVHNDVRRADEFAGSFHLSGSAKAGEACQLFNAVDNRLRDIPGSGGIVLLDAFNSGFKLVGGFGCPANQPHE